MPLAIFDIDGTLVDSRASIHEAACLAARRLGIAEPVYDAVRQIVGLSLHEALRTLEPGLTDAELAEFVAGFQGAFQEMHARPGWSEPLYPGAAELLRRLGGDGWRIAMATGNSRRGVERLLLTHGWTEVFASTHCADDGPGKPHPDMIHKALAAASAGPERAVMIGDTAHDMRMAVAAGVRPQGVAWGFHTADENLAGGAAHVAHDFFALEEALEDFAAGLSQDRARGP